MTKQCELTGVKVSYGNNVSHAHNKSRRRWLPNLQRIKANINGSVKRIQVCTSCIRSGKVVKAV